MPRWRPRTFQRFAPGRGGPTNPFLLALGSSFEGATKARGEEYLQKVHFLSASADLLRAKVAGSWLYQVEVARVGNELVASCTCPYVDRFAAPCKHIWATLSRAAFDQLEFARVVPAGLRATSPEGVGQAREPSFARTREDSDADLAEFDSQVDGAPDNDAPNSASSVTAARAPHRGARALDDFVDDELGRSELGTDSANGRSSGAPSADSPVDAPWYAAFERVQRAEGPPRASSLLYGLDPDDLRQGVCRVYLMRRPRVVSAEALEMAPTFEPLRDVGSALGRDARPIEHWLRASAEDDARVRFSAFRAANVPISALPTVVPELCATGRCYLVRAQFRPSGGAFQPLTKGPLHWEAGAPYLIELSVSAAEGATPFRLEGFLVRGAERVSLSVPDVVTPSGIVIWGERASRCDFGEAEAMLGLLRDSRYRWVLSESDLEELSRSHAALEAPVRLTLPPGFELRDEVVIPVPLLELEPPGPSGVPARVSFVYGEQHVPLGTDARSIVDWPARKRFSRRSELEQQRLQELASEGLPSLMQREDGAPLRRPKALVLAAKRVPAIARVLLEKGWRVEAQGKAYRAAGDFKVSVRSGIDWFDFDARLAFGQTSAGLPELLRALRQKSALVTLDDGTLGVLPEEWLERWGVLEGMTGLEDGKLRFRRAELPLLAALVERAPGADVDRGFLKLRREFERFSGVEPSEPPKSFRGELRPYQAHGLGWLQFLSKMGFGGCLADDMGLGKTVQVIAWLAGRPGRGRPTLIVVPRSLVFNWQQELERFAPRLKVATHLGAVRSQAPAFDDTDVVLTTYGTLLRDIARLQKIRFFAAILDEAQAIKNHTSQTAKAARLLQADQRLAMSGTPIENHLGELWSLFEFLNPNLLGRAKGLKKAAEGARGVDDAGIQFLSRVLRPFVLRRSKAEVASDLPERSEQTLYIELGKEEKAHYAEILRHFQLSLQKKVAQHGLDRATPHVLEALLRLRQVACHPGLLDPKRREDPSAKLEVLLAHLEELVERGMKSLVFSQFTSFLGIVREELDRRGIAYEYLDGDTQDRKARVDNFQREDGPRVFLISLKAGGVGLNLTQAEYVFLLDPWWNPAVEAQAIDRAHRIGQTRRVVAYRLIAKDTVEQKVEALQDRKRELAAALFGEGAGFTGKLTREDLTALLE